MWRARDMHDRGVAVHLQPPLRRQLMQTLPRIAAVLIFPAIAYLGAACEPDTPTAARPLAAVAADPPLVVDDDGMASPTNCDASDPAYPTISMAVAAASPGATIKVCPGTYNESVTIGMPLTLLGPNAGTSWNGGR